MAARKHTYNYVPIVRPLHRGSDSGFARCAVSAGPKCTRGGPRCHTRPRRVVRRCVHAGIGTLHDRRTWYSHVPYRFLGRARWPCPRAARRCRDSTQAAAATTARTAPRRPAPCRYAAACANTDQPMCPIGGCISGQLASYVHETVVRAARNHGTVAAKVHARYRFRVCGNRAVARPPLQVP